jgi:hypothetical protein
MTKHHLVFPVLLLSLLATGCATNPAARRAAVALHGSLGEYQKALDEKIAEQEAFYTKRQQHTDVTRSEAKDDDFATSRRLRALDYASRLTADPAKLVRIDTILDFLLKSSQDDFEEYKAQRATEAAAEKQFNTAFDTLERQSAAIAAARNALSSLASPASRRQRLKAAALFAEQLKSELAKQNQKK